MPLLVRPRAAGPPRQVIDYAFRRDTALSLFSFAVIMRVIFIELMAFFLGFIFDGFKGHFHKISR